MPLLECKDLVKVYPGGKRAVAGVSFDVEPGEVVGLLGPNGAGKSTTFRMACGLNNPTAGRVELNGTDVTDWPMYKRARHQVDPAALAAIVIEPVQGEAGFIPMPDRFLIKIRELCTRHGIVMIADEVQTGFGRTGTLFAVETSGVVPDLVTTAKALGAGLPISATTGRADIMDAAHVGGAGGTYGGSPLACVAAIEAVNIIRQPAFLAHARRLGEVMRVELERWRASSALIGDVRGKGPMLLVELVLDRETKTPAPEHAVAAIRRAVANGVVLIRAGLFSNCIRFMPPLNISEADLMEALEVVGEAIRHVEANGPGGCP
jgi:4-aminobutyrate aminotransferase/(S)-3-amino-2-methylpropionate transaminase